MFVLNCFSLPSWVAAVLRSTGTRHEYAFFHGWHPEMLSTSQYINEGLVGTFRVSVAPILGDRSDLLASFLCRNRVFVLDQRNSSESDIDGATLRVKYWKF
ncbi:hypothetical protein ARMGADRAFT_484822 [Armillaria gallica]|uniref:Uncharacterized protein n=1 Tax=Armillaria gallica TaxID=47427 RepID=A0A2H3DYL0_ARMGA|nr:hypothetical protein ARMGADRAFT_484822 [Armillaria gallica]